jgi:hypothetical protein
MSSILDDLQRLRKGVDWSLTQRRPFLDNRRMFLNQYVGAHYSDTGEVDKVPANLIELGVGTYARHILGGETRALVTPVFSDKFADAVEFGMGLDMEIRECGFDPAVHGAVKDAFFLNGMVKIGNDYDGKCYVATIDSDDQIIDMNAREWNQCEYIGNFYNARLDDVLDSGLANTVRAKLKDHAGGMGSATNATGQYPTMNDRAESLSGRTDREQTSIYDQIRLMDIWLPREKKIITLDCIGLFEKPIRVVNWKGPDHYGGCYHFLGFDNVPGNLMPLPPVSLWYDLHDLVNRLYRKLGRQAERQKKALAFEGGDDKDAERANAVPDGGAFQMNSKVHEETFGGIDAQNLAFRIQATEDWKSWAGNIDTLAGLGPQAGTAAQDEQIGRTASVRPAAMKDSVDVFKKECIEALGSYVWTDPSKVYRFEKPIRGTDSSIPVKWGPGKRKGKWSDFQFNISPYSHRNMSPIERYRQLVSFMNEMVAPYLPMMMQTGKAINFEDLYWHAGRLLGMPEIEDVLDIIPLSERGGGLNDHDELSAGKPPITKRSYERTNRPGATNTGQNNVMMRALVGQASQKSEASTIGRAIA